MIKIARPQNFRPQQAISKTGEIADTVAKIIADVIARKDAALIEYTKKFDGDITDLRVSETEIEGALTRVDEYFVETLKQAKKNIEEYHERQKRTGYEIVRDGVILGQRVLPIEKVGIYVPSGTARYPSTVLMNVIPAKIAGVEKIVVATPPNRDGSIPDVILAAAKIAGADEIYKMGGAQAIAALAYGTETIPRVYKIVGPGNAFVAEAKRQVFGQVDIDMIAGPSEILIISDGKSDPSYVAADMLSQAEHDKNASAILVTDSADLVEKVKTELYSQLDKLPRREIALASIENNGKIIITDDLFQAAEIANEIAPEHLEICTDDPFELLKMIKNAGSVFLGRYTTEPLGDYFAGVNHTLPTSGTAKFSSPLSVDDFVKKTSYSQYTKEALQKVGARVADFAEREGLRAHANAIRIRTEGK